jgi:hypothetical protein
MLWFDHYHKILNSNGDIDEKYFIDIYFNENSDKTFSLITANKNNDIIKKMLSIYTSIKKKTQNFKLVVDK